MLKVLYGVFLFFAVGSFAADPCYPNVSFSGVVAKIAGGECRGDIAVRGANGGGFIAMGLPPGLNQEGACVEGCYDPSEILPCGGLEYGQVIQAHSCNR